MQDKDKDRDPDKANKRAKGDARCALRKLGLLDELLAAYESGNAGEAFDIVGSLGEALSQ